MLVRFFWFSGSHAPAWEPILDAPASSFFWFPRAGVGIHSRRASVVSIFSDVPVFLLPQIRDAGASGLGYHASAWEPELTI
jgi:hypothetical protein